MTNIKQIINRWFSIVLSACAYGTKGKYTAIKAEHWGYWVALMLLCEAEDNSRFARSLDRDLNNDEIWSNMQLLGAARKLLHKPLNRAAAQGIALPNKNPDVYQYWARYWKR